MSATLAVAAPRSESSADENESYQVSLPIGRLVNVFKSWSEIFLDLFNSSQNANSAPDLNFVEGSEYLEEFDWQTSEEARNTDITFAKQFYSVLNGQHFIIHDTITTAPSRMPTPDGYAEAPPMEFGRDYLKQKKRPLEIRDGSETFEVLVPRQVFSDYGRNRFVVVQDEWGEISKLKLNPSEENVQFLYEKIYEKILSICGKDVSRQWPGVLLYSTTQGFDVPLQKFVVQSFYAAMKLTRPHTRVYSKGMLEDPFSGWGFSTDSITTSFRFSQFGVEITNTVGQTLKKESAFQTSNSVQFTLQRKLNLKYGEMCNLSRTPEFPSRYKPFENASFRAKLIQ